MGLLSDKSQRIFLEIMTSYLTLEASGCHSFEPGIVCHVTDHATPSPSQKHEIIEI